MAPAQPGVSGKRRRSPELAVLCGGSEARGEGTVSRGWSAGHMSQCYLQGLLQEGGVGLQGHSQVQALVPCDLAGRNRARTAEAWPPSPHHPTALHRMENGSQGQAPGNRTLLLPEVKQAPEGPGTLPAVELRAGPAAGRRFRGVCLTWPS